MITKRGKMQLLEKHDLDNVYNSLFDWIANESFTGYDPYDGVNTRYTMLKKYKATRLLLTYFNKFSPVNFRPLLGVDKRVNIQGLALICQSLLRYPPDVPIDYDIERYLDYILSKSLIDKYGYHCWNGNDMYVQTKKEYQSRDMPGVVGTEACASAIFEYYKHNLQRNDLREVLFSVKSFFLNELLQTYDGATFIRYKPMTKAYDCVYNASAIAAQYISKINDYFSLNEGNEVVKLCYQYLLSRQKTEGVWYFSIDLRNGRQKPQVDFHQGFVLDALLTYMQVFGEDADIRDAYLRGLNYYKEKQFDINGRGLYRYPRFWPINIHNQAQGIITFVKAIPYGEEYGHFANKIARWTIYNMRDNDGFFFYLKYPFFTNKIPYIRWGQAWMMNALSFLLKSEE